MRNTHVKKRIVDISSNKEELIYYTEEELSQIKIEKEEQQLLELLEPSDEEIKKAEFDLNILLLLEEVGVIWQLYKENL